MTPTTIRIAVRLTDAEAEASRTIVRRMAANGFTSANTSDAVRLALLRTAAAMSAPASDTLSMAA